jgi:hypothetical protein
MTRTQLVVLAVAFVVSLGLGVSVQSGSAASLNVNTQNLTPYRTCIVTATPTTTTSEIDASVRQATPTGNFGTATTVDVASAASANRRTYLKFDLSGCTPAIPSSATVRVATLRIYASALPTTVCRTLDIFRVTATWAEATITWNVQPTSNATRTDSFDIGTAAGCQNIAAGYVTGADVTADVSAYVAGTATNYGWMIRDDTESSTTTRTATFSAKNLGTLAQEPQLVVTYVTTP